MNVVSPRDRRNNVVTIQRKGTPFVYEPMKTMDIQVQKPVQPTNPEESVKHMPYENIWMTCVRVPVQMVFDYEDMRYREQIDWFCEHILLSWTIEEIKTLEDGTKVQQPVPTTKEGMRGLEHPMILAILDAWYQAVLRPDENLGSAS